MRATSRIFLLSILTVVCLCLVGPTQAASLDITALVQAQPANFQLQLSSQPTTTLHSGQTVTVTLTYGSHLSGPTDTMILVATWSQATSLSTAPISPFMYVANSATTAIGSAQPVIDYSQRTITWTISPFPSGVNRQVSWQLKLDPSIAITQPLQASISASLFSAGVQVVANPLSFTLTPAAPNQSSPTPLTTPTLTPSLIITPSATPLPFSPQAVTLAAPAAWQLLVVILALVGLVIITLHHYPWHQLWLVWRHRRHVVGHVTHQDQPLPAAMIRFHPLSTTGRPGQAQTAITDRHGRYHLDLSPGTYAISVLTKQHYPQPHQQLLDLPPHPSTTYVLNLSLDADPAPPVTIKTT